MNLELRVDPIRKVRNENKVPGVMYGTSFKSTSIQVDDKELKEALKTHGKNITFKVKLEGKEHFAYIQHIETTILKPHDIIHFDLRCVGAKEMVSVMIPVVLVGKEVFHKTALYPQETLTEIEAEYLPGYGVSHIDIDVSEMKLGDSVRVKDLVLDSHIHLLEDPEQAVVTIKEIHIKVEEEEVDEDELETDDESEEETVVE